MKRTTQEELRRFREHKARWERGEIRLLDYVTTWRKIAGETVPLWYPPPLGMKVLWDKAQLFDLIGYRPSEPQCRFHAEAQAKVLLFVGGARAGKSRAGAMEMVPVLLTPGTNQWIVAPEYGQAVKEFGYILDAIHHPTLWPNLTPFLVREVNRPDQGDMEIRFKWREGLESFVLVKTEKVQKSLLSEELDQVLLVEASQLKRSTWTKYLRARLITRDGRAVIPTSPNGIGWVAELERLGEERSGGVATIHADTRYNPTVDVDVVDFWGAEMTDQEWAEQVLGIATPLEGYVYPEFNPAAHVDPWEATWPRPSWRRYRVMDFGYTHPMAILWAAVDEDKRVYIYREIYKSGLLTDQALRMAAEAEGNTTEYDPELDLLKWKQAEKGEKITITIADWDAQQCAEFRARGWRIKKARKEVLSGIRLVKRALQVRPDGRPGLYISPACKETIREFRSYAWAEGKEEPKKENDHAMDAIRYLIHTLGIGMGRDLRVRILKAERRRSLLLPGSGGVSIWNIKNP